MKTNSHPDHELHNLLQVWKVDDRDDPALSARVWNKIESTRGVELPVWMEPFIGWVLRPVGSVVIVSAFVLLGAALAEVRFDSTREASVERLVAEYVSSIDPVLMAGYGAGREQQ